MPRVRRSIQYISYNDWGAHVEPEVDTKTIQNLLIRRGDVTRLVAHPVEEEEGPACGSLGPRQVTSYCSKDFG